MPEYLQARQDSDWTYEGAGCDKIAHREAGISKRRHASSDCRRELPVVGSK